MSLSKIVVCAAVLLSASSSRAQQPPIDFDAGVDVSAIASALRSAARATSRLDPTAAPYPVGPAEEKAERERVSGWLSLRLAALPGGATKALAMARATGVPDLDLCHGSHVIVRDAGALYAAWASMDARPRISSHYSGLDVQQYELRLPGIGVLLFGKDWDGDTWFQLEPYGVDGPDAVAHAGEFIRHEVTGGMNVGPLGLSPRTDARGTPIVISAAPGGETGGRHSF